MNAKDSTVFEVMYLPLMARKFIRAVGFINEKQSESLSFGMNLTWHVRSSEDAEHITVKDKRTFLNDFAFYPVKKENPIGQYIEI